MTKATAIRSLKLAQSQMNENPDLDDADVLSLMEEAIADALEFFTGKRPRSCREVDCAKCGKPVHLQDAESTYSGSMHPHCVEEKDQ